MRAQIPAGAIPLIPVESRQPEHYRIFIISSLVLAGLAGFLLGLHIPLGRLFDWSSEGRRPDIIQVHGQVQLLGFAGLFVIGMSLRMMPRFAGSSLKLGVLVPVVWGLIAGSLAVRAFIQVWLPDDPRTFLAVATAYTLLLGAGAYMLIATATLTVDRHGLDGTSWFFLVGALFFLAQAGLGVLMAVDAANDAGRLLPYLPNTAMLHLQIFGFLMSFIGGVSTRAFPSMMGRDRPDAGARRAAFLLLGAVSLHTAPLLWAEYGGYATGLARVSGLGLALTGMVMLEIARLTGVLTPAANRVAPASRAQFRLVRLAAVWIVLAGLFAIYLGLKGLVDGEVPAFFDLDALRHMVALGVVTTLIVGMGLLILPEFAGERIGAHSQTAFSSALLVVLTAVVVLRAGPPLLLSAGSDSREIAMAIAGILIETVILYFLFRFVSLVRRMSARHA